MNGSIVSRIFPRISHSSDLVESVKCRAITLELEDIDMLRSLHDAIHSAFALFLLDVNRKTANHSQDKVEGVLEITFLLSSIILATLALWASNS